MFGNVPDELKADVTRAAARPDAAAAVRAVYADLQTEIDRRKPVCVASGKCCHFSSYGHRLYVTTLELAVFVADLNGAIVPPATDPGGCRFQTGRLCGVHAVRPFGCRIFFCDPTATQWQQDHYESFHARLKQLHERFEIPYHYVEWRAGLAALFDG